MKPWFGAMELGAAGCSLAIDTLPDEIHPMPEKDNHPSESTQTRVAETLCTWISRQREST